MYFYVEGRKSFFKYYPNISYSLYIIASISLFLFLKNKIYLWFLFKFIRFKIFTLYNLYFFRPLLSRFYRRVAANEVYNFEVFYHENIENKLR